MRRLGVAMDDAILALQEGCCRKQLPLSTARELIRFLLYKNLNPILSEGWSPSSKLDALQHWTLLNTRVRKLVEAVVGEISHSEELADLPDEDKVERRQALSPWCHLNIGIDGPLK